MNDAQLTAQLAADVLESVANLPPIIVKTVDFENANATNSRNEAFVASLNSDEHLVGDCFLKGA